MCHVPPGGRKVSPAWGRTDLAHKVPKVGRKRTTRITIETDQVLVLRGCYSSRRWCSQCGADVDFVSFEEASVVAQTAPQALLKLLEGNTLHLLGEVQGLPRICVNSLLKMT